MCCNEAECCGPCCSTRSWFVTHVVFVMLGAIFMIPVLVMFGTISAVLAHTNEAAGETVADERITNFVTGITATGVIVIIFDISWTVVGWIVVCGNNAKALAAYMVFCGIDMGARIVFVLVFIIQSAEIDDRLPIGVGGLVGQTAVWIGIMDVAPMICFCACRARVLSRCSAQYEAEHASVQGGVNPVPLQGSAQPQPPPYVTASTEKF